MHVTWKKTEWWEQFLEYVFLLANETYQNGWRAMLLKENPNFPLKIIIQILSMTTAPVTLTHISLDKNPAPFLDPLHFHFTFQTQRPLNAPL